MRVSAFKTLVCWAMIIITPISLVAQDGAAAAIVDSKGTVLLNGSPIPEASAIQDGDAIQTTENSVATITAKGSNIIIQPMSSVKLVSNSIFLDHGSISVGSSSGMITSAATATVTPTAATWTEYEVTNVNGAIEVLARKGELNVNCGKEGTALAEGSRVSSDASGKCIKDRKNANAYPPASGDILQSPYWKYIAAGAGGGVLIWLLWPKPKQPASASQP